MDGSWVQWVEGIHPVRWGYCLSVIDCASFCGSQTHGRDRRSIAGKKNSSFRERSIADTRRRSSGGENLRNTRGESEYLRQVVVFPAAWLNPSRSLPCTTLQSWDWVGQCLDGCLRRGRRFCTIAW